MRKHNTPKEKRARRKAYQKLRKAGIPVSCAIVIRDWTDNKIEMICRGEAEPAFLYFVMKEVNHVEKC